MEVLLWPNLGTMPVCCCLDTPLLYMPYCLMPSLPQQCRTLLHACWLWHVLRTREFVSQHASCFSSSSTTRYCSLRVPSAGLSISLQKSISLVLTRCYAWRRGYTKAASCYLLGHVLVLPQHCSFQHCYRDRRSQCGRDETPIGTSQLIHTTPAQQSLQSCRASRLEVPCGSRMHERASPNALVKAGSCR